MSFQATEWARSLPLHSLSAKFTLMMIGSYAGTDGACFPSLGRLADDTLQSIATVRRRVRELEELGVLVRFSRWASPDGKVVLTAVGDDSRPTDCRQSSDELRLQMQITAEQVKERISVLGWDKKRQSDQVDDMGDEASAGVANCDPPPSHSSDTLPPATAVQPSPSQSCDRGRVSPGSHPLNRPLNSSGETAPHHPPQSGGRYGLDLGTRRKGESRLAEIKPIWPEPIANEEKAIAILGALDDQEWPDCRTGTKGYAAMIALRKESGKERIVKDFHNWARNRQWAGFLDRGNAIEAAARRVHFHPGSPEGEALLALHRIAGLSEPQPFGGVLSFPRPLTPRELALAERCDEANWTFIGADRPNQAAAWRSLLREAFGDRALPELVRRRFWGRGIGNAIGFAAPGPWPPRKDGTWSDVAPDTGCSDEEAQCLKING